MLEKLKTHLDYVTTAAVAFVVGLLVGNSNKKRPSAKYFR